MPKPNSTEERLRKAEEAIELGLGEFNECRAERDEAITALKKAELELAAAKEELATRVELAELMSRIAPMETYELQQVKAAVDCVSSNAGCTTPVENFIVNILNRYCHAGFLTPDGIASELETFRADFKDIVEDCARLVHRYEKSLAAQTAE